MDFDVVGKVLIILLVMPFVLLAWGAAFMLIDDALFGGVFQDRIKQWVRDKMEDEE